jgi:hypothetical protein
MILPTGSRFLYHLKRNDMKDEKVFPIPDYKIKTISARIWELSNKKSLSKDEQKELKALRKNQMIGLYVWIDC